MPKIYRKFAPVVAGLAVLAVPTLSQAVQAQSYPVTQYGNRGPAVKTAELSLHQLGYYHGAIDSIFGPELLLAVRSFQAHDGLAQDGIIGPLTWDKLTTAVGTSKTHSTSASPDFTDAAHLLRLGNRGPGVVHLQRLLDQHGYHLAIDGDFGPLTYGAVRQFQASHDLAVNGIVGPSTLSALIHDGAHTNSASPKMQAPPPTYPPGYLHLGDSGPAIKRLQFQLTRAGYSTHGINGHFGPLTLKAVETFQLAEHLPAHGLVGALTWGALHRVLAAKPVAHKAPPTLSNRGSISPTAAAIVGIAMKYRGYPYVWGGNTPSGFDCSGFTQWVYRQVGVSLPRTTFSQWNVGTHVSYDQLQPGDLVFFTTEGVFCNHVGIYLGGGEFISAATPSQGVIVQSLSNPFFAQAYDGAISVVN